MRLPRDIAAITGRKEVVRTLGTADPVTAKRLLPVVWAAWERTMSIIRSTPAITRQDVDRIVNDFIRTELDGYRALHNATASVESLRGVIEREDAARPQLRRRIAQDIERGEPFWTRDHLESFLDSRGMPIHRDSPAYREMMRALALAWLSTLDAMDNGAPAADPLPDQPATPEAPIVAPTIRPEREAARPSIEASLPWRSQEERFFADRPSIGDSARVSHRQAFRELEALIGVKPLGDVAVADIKKFADYLRDKPIERAGRTRLSRETIVKLLSHIRGYFGWAVESGFIAENPAEKVKARTETREERERIPRRAFHLPELETLFRSPLFVGCCGVNLRHRPGTKVFRDGRFYYFLVGLLTGARTEEIADAPSRLVDHHGVLCLDLLEAGKKTAAGPRLVPILPALQRTGFVKFARDQERVGQMLFREVTGDWSGWTNAFLDNIGITDRTVTGYSLRHNFRQMLRASGIIQELIDKVFGHEGQSVGSGYGRDLSPAEARLVIERVVPPIDLSHLYIHEPG